MVSPETPHQRRELAGFLRACRERLSPEAIGLPAGTRRRTPGLRREEVAQLSGVSTTWYTWIEQARDVSASPQALARLAQALRLGRAERAYLFELAEKRDPDHGGSADDGIPAVAVSCVHAMSVPAYVLDRHWNALDWNAAAAALFAGWLDKAAKDGAIEDSGARNLLRFIFMEPSSRRLICDWDERARRVAAEFRAATSLHLDDPALQALVDELGDRSPEFAEYWDRHGVLDREGGLRTFEHPEMGFLRYEQVTYDLAGHPDVRLTMLLPAADGDRV